MTDSDDEFNDPIDDEVIAEEPEVEPEAEVEAETEEDGFTESVDIDYNNIIIVNPNDRRTSQSMSNAEYVEILSIRTEQIAKFGAMGAMIDPSPEMISARDIAIAELRARKCPLRIRRHVGTTMKGSKKVAVYEDWSPNDMTHPSII